MAGRGRSLFVSWAIAALGAVPGAGCTGKTDLPSATLAAPEDNPSDLAPEPPPAHVRPDGPRLYARAMETRVYERPNPRARVLGYVRLGQSVARSDGKVPGVSATAAGTRCCPTATCASTPARRSIRRIR